MVKVASILRGCETFLFDCDGLENNKNIICSAHVAATFLRDNPPDGEVYVIGESGISTELKKFGIPHHGVGVKAVLVGFDSHFNYRKLMQATSYISKGASFYATNEDAQLPGGNIVLPGTGSIVSAVKVASGKEPVVFGKPHKPMFDLLCKYCDLDPSKTIMVGDNLYTDIAFGNKFGLYTACVLTGVTNQKLIDKVNTTPGDEVLRPKFVFESVADILNILKT
ncbi:unnamed protein product [Trichobilharzia regenti]|nr:unnamed protein product [Trichobilharzia regenti]